MAVQINVVGKYTDKDLDRARRALDQLGDKADRAGQRSTKSFKGMATAAAIAGAAIAIKFGADSVKAYAEAEGSQARLEAAFEKFPALADTNIDAMRALNSELQRKTKYDDDQTAAAQAVLAQFKLTGNEIERLTPLMQDYATATGQDVTSAAQSLGKAFMGNAKALKAIGIDFKATGNTAQDFDTIVAALRQQVGGLAEREGKTAAGQLAILDNQIGDLKESVGEALMPALTGLVDIAKPAVGLFAAMPVPVRQTAIAVGVLSTAAVVAVPRIVAVKRALSETSLMAGKSGKAMKGAALGFLAFEAGAVVASHATSDSVNSQTEDMRALLEQIGRTGKGYDQLGYSVEGFTDYTKDFSNAVARSQAPDWLDQVGQALGNFAHVKDDLTLATESVQGVDQALADMVQQGHGAAAADAMQKLRDQYAAAGYDMTLFEKAFPKYIDQQKAAAQATTIQARATSQLKNAFESLDAILSKRGAARAWKTDLDGIAGAVKNARGHFTDATVKGREFNDWLDQSMGDLSRYAQSFSDPLDQQRAFSGGLKAMRERLAKMGLSKAEIDKILKPFRGIKTEADSAAGAIEGVATDWADLRKKLSKTIRGGVKITVTSDGDVVGHGTGHPGRATGGPVAAGRTYWVGEHGPELFTSAAPGYVIDSASSRRVAAAAAASPTYQFSSEFNFNGTGAPTQADIDRALARWTDDVIRKLRAHR